MDFYNQIIDNIRKILQERGFQQQDLAAYAEINESQVSKIFSGKARLSIQQLSKMATGLQMSELDIITWPDKFVKVGASEPEPVEAFLQLRLKKDKKDQVLRLVFGDNNIEILNR